MSQGRPVTETGRNRTPEAKTRGALLWGACLGT